MYIHNVTRGATFDITLEDGREIRAAFDGTIDHMNFYVLCPELTKNADAYFNKEVSVKFNVADKDYSFTAQILRKSVRNDVMHETMDFKILTPFKEIPLRESFRIEINITVKVHTHDSDFRKMYTGGWLCDASSVDVSKDAMKLWMDYDLNESPAALYTLEFTLRQGKTYFVPAKLMRNQRNTETRSYNYECIFVFDFTGDDTKRDKLFLDIMEYKLRGR